MRYLVALFAGGLFGAGLLLSGMTDTVRVQGFLDVFGAWDPTLAFVMGGAILPMTLAWAIARRRLVALLGTPMQTRADDPPDPGFPPQSTPPLRARPSRPSASAARAGWPFFLR